MADTLGILLKGTQCVQKTKISLHQKGNLVTVGTSGTAKAVVSCPSIFGLLHVYCIGQ